MLQAFVATGFTFGIIGVLFVAPFMLCKGILLMNEDVFSGFNVVKAALPVFNIFYAEVQYGRRFPVTGITNLLCTLSFIGVVVTMFMMPEYLMFRFVLLCTFFFFTVIAYVCSCQLVASIVSASDDLFGLKKIFYIAFFPMGYYYIGNYFYKIVLLESMKLNALEVDG